MRDENVLESALARPRQKWHFADMADVPALGAAYAFGFVRNHPYLDGNKRIGFLSMVTFLGMNGFDFEADDAGVVAEILALAEGSIGEDELASWVRHHVVKRRPV